MNVASDNSIHEATTQRPQWLLPVMISGGMAAGIALIGSLLLLMLWLFTAERANTEISSRDETLAISAIASRTSNAPSTPVYIADDTTQDETNSDAETTASPSTPIATEVVDKEPTETEVSTNEPPLNVEPFQLEDVPIIGSGLADAEIAPVTSDVSGDGRHEDTPEELDVPFLVLGCAPSTDGLQVVAWGCDWQKDAAPSSTPRTVAQRPPESRLAIIDVATRKILADRTIDAVITQVDFNATGVYVTANENPDKQEMSVLRLSFDDLQSLDRASILLGTITSIADQLLVSERRDNRGSKKYVLPSLEEADPASNPITGLSRSQSSRRLADGWLLDGVVWDNNLDAPKLLCTPTSFHPLTPNLSRPGGIVAVPILQGYLTHTSSGKTPSFRNTRFDRGQYSPHVPAILKLSDNRGKISLDFLEHNSGKKVRSVMLSSGTPRLSRLVTTPDWIFATLDSRTFVLPTHSDRSPITVPFRLEPKQSTVAFASNTAITVRYEASDATKFELELPSVVVDGKPFKQQSSTGEFTFNLTGSVSQIVKAMNEAIDKERRAFNGDIAVWAESYGKEVHDNFVKLTKREPDGIPLKMDAYVRAYGKDLSVAVMHHVYLVEVPVSEFEQYRRTAASPHVAKRDRHPAPVTKPLRPQATPTVPNVTSELRTWTDTKGRTLQAKFVQLDGEVVVVIDSKDRTLRVPLERFSKEDRAWVSEQTSP